MKKKINVTSANAINGKGENSTVQSGAEFLFPVSDMMRKKEKTEGLNLS